MALSKRLVKIIGIVGGVILIVIIVVLLSRDGNGTGISQVDLDTNDGTATVVWDFATEPEFYNEWEGVTNQPTCVDADLGFYMMPISFDGADIFWDDGAIYTDAGGFWFSLELPDGGNYVTMRVQMHLTPDAGPEPPAEPQAQECVPTEVDGCNVRWEEADVTSNGSVVNGEWHYVTETYDGTNIRIYIDGVLDIEQAESINTVLNVGRFL